MLMASAQGAADRHGVLLTAAADSEQALAACRDEGLRLVLIDLRLPGLDVAEFVGRVRGAKPQAARVVACGPHVHTHTLAAAAEAGCDEVITRGEFDRRIPSLLAELTARAAGPPAER
jgi:CheY-like chemotaxis protein